MTSKFALMRFLAIYLNKPFLSVSDLIFLKKDIVFLQRDFPHPNTKALFKLTTLPKLTDLKQFKLIN